MANPTLDFKGMSALVGATWKALSEAEKNRYKEEAKKAFKGDDQ